jgi:hypothetical protein
MIPFLRSLHLLALSCWFGSLVFFSIVGLLIFNAFEEVARLPSESRPLWLPLPAEFSRDSLGKGFPEPIRLEQGSRAAGVAVSKIFPVYYALQTGCALVALLSALVLARSSLGTGHRLRVWLAAIALATVLLGWGLEVYVAELRVPRNTLTDEVLIASEQGPIEEARAARAKFGMWHGMSLLQNFATLAVVFWLVLLVPGMCLQKE